MKVTMSFKNLEHNRRLDEKIRQKTSRLHKFLDENTEVHWTCHSEEDTDYASIRVTGPSFQCNASGESDNIYKALDLALHKVQKQLSKKKGSLKNRIHHQGADPLELNLERSKRRQKAGAKEGRDSEDSDDEYLDAVG
ncbi:MAG: ribosome-associated translation inhibitor RaiA [Oligoflexia bacterium]|nr:ribosome-associated translation inhibitor RaiA [Oligoflexia bacterium]